MSYSFDGETQKKEIETIKPRQFNLNLSDADMKRIFEKASTCNITVEYLLESFIGDLIYGTYSNGSDERMYAENWFERCGFSWMYEKTFLVHLLRHDFLENVIGIWEDIQVFKEELQYSKEAPTEFTKEEIEALKNDLEDSQKELNNHYSDFKEWAECDVRSLEEEMKEVFEWIQKRDEKINGVEMLKKCCEEYLIENIDTDISEDETRYHVCPVCNQKHKEFKDNAFHSTEEVD